MRIGIDARELAEGATGIGRYLAELVARWTRAPWATSHDLRLFTPYPVAVPSGCHGTTGATLTVEVVDGVGGTSWEQISLARAAARAGLDVFFAPGYTAPLMLRVPLVVSVHDVSFAAHPEWFTWREGLRRRIVTRLTARRAARVVTLTKFSGDEIVRLLGVDPSMITIIPPAVDAHPALLPARLAADRRAPAGAMILYVGSIFTRRHVPDLIDAFSTLAGERNDVRLMLIGADRSWPPEWIAERIQRSGFSGRIEWQDWIDEAELRELYSEARVIAFLSEYEGFGLTPLEGLAHGVPPVVADVAVAHEAYGDAAAYVSPTDRARLVETLRSLLDDEVVRSRLLNAATGVLARYSWDDTARSTFEVLQAAASRAQR